MPKNVYASAKSYSKRGRLLSREDFATLAEARDLEELMVRIKNTAYGDAVASVPKPYTSQGIEEALRARLAEVHHMIARSSGRSKILDAYYMRFIITNLKMILKGKAMGKSQEEMEPHVNLRAEELVKKRDIVVKALAAKDLEEAVSGLGQARMADEMSKAVSLYNETKNLQVFDTYFDKILYARLGSALSKADDAYTSKIVGMDIDFYNIMSMLRGKFWGLDGSQLDDLVASHTAGISKELLHDMAGADTLRAAFAELGATKYKTLVPSTDNELDALAEFERSFEMLIYSTAHRSFSRMFSFATIVGITKLTAYEVRNIAAIAFAVEQGIPAGTTISKLILRE